MSEHHTLWMDVAKRAAQESLAVRLRVGCVIVKDDYPLAVSWNGTPKGTDNVCEIPDSMHHGYSSGAKLVTKPDVLHAEENALLRVGKDAKGATMYLTHNPCQHCAAFIKQAGITRVYYAEYYRDSVGLDYLKDNGVIVEKFIG